ncbi:hypothetical protein CALVIDRAFT_566912 [Calocera viscosa TUFC12733]|uniref:F-box domain-containing protein n=1 Tax=Calocera viscosa (strain TUFC12733) TaxID=1330018 RepID=A0A167IV78_CALVF|nr:hypothetical protein CALVIDRAFT_566912 [Calocera viscosa TUFC12733]
MSALLSLPPELLDDLLSHVPSPADLLSLSLTCHALYTATADHLPWRRICVYEYDTPLFSLLSSTRRLASQLRRIAVNETGHPTASHSPMDDFSPSLSGPAHKLSAYRPVLPATRDPRANTGGVEPLLPQVARNCAQLEEVRLNVYDLRPWKGFFQALKEEGGRTLGRVEIVEEPGPWGWALGDAEEVLELLGGHEHFAWASATIVQGALLSPGKGPSNLLPASELVRLITTLLTDRCPTLSSLSLYVFSTLNPIPSALPTFSARFPALRSLSLGHVRSTELIGTFLDAHPLLERVSIQCAGHAEVTISPSSLPLVREFDVVWINSPGLYTQVLAPLPNGDLRPLEVLSITAGAFREEGSVDGLCGYLRAHKGIKGIRWEDTSMQLSERLGAIGAASPGVRTLSILAFYLDRRLPEIAAALHHFPNLEQILIGRGRLEVEHCADLQVACPTLVRIGPWERCEAGGVDEKGRQGLAWRKRGRRDWAIVNGP